ncbi:hydroxyacylglutathione hydrolase [Hyphococcus flavus]|uniref:Hydroxyacylglutathione hydrolase n=1 Tax=Hyphococcus flavus TaxID=1866326 RepID=A0AAF0CH85_9PROT|nr:hydroxyacylglutathione hydrolase [Hyphococcus flavus]WDI33148.1 hydroxyacylglutathione hydrolase [Hyphococcus flavus]
MAIEIRQFPCLKDNYGFLIRDRSSGLTASIDTPDAAEINRQLDNAGWRLTHILNTHWHPDHAGGNIALKKKWGCEIIGPRAEADKIPSIDCEVGDDDIVNLGRSEAKVFDTPGHTLGHIIYHFADDGAAFVGDTVFALGCGRLCEGTPAQMWNSLQKIIALPPETKLYCAHEYTQANAKFALSIDPENKNLKERANEIDKMRLANKPTVPTVLSLELETNPFLRAGNEQLQNAINMNNAGAVESFAKIRALKDVF